MNWYNKIAQTNENYIAIASAHGYSSGFHGSGNYPERPADNCRDHVTWEPLTDNIQSLYQICGLLIGQEVIFYERSSFRSYHECQVAGYLYIKVPPELTEQIIELGGEIGAIERTYYKQKDEHKTIFKSLQETIKEIEELSGINQDVGLYNDIPKDTSSQQWWQEKIDKATNEDRLNNPRNYKPEGD